MIDKKNFILIIFLFAVVLFSVWVMADCDDDEDCDDGKVCTIDTCENETECPQGCTIDNCTDDCWLNWECENKKISGCDEEDYVEAGQTFHMGRDDCRLPYRFESVDEDENEVVISGETYHYSESAATTDENGHKITIDNDYNSSYIIRYDEDLDALYLDHVRPSCPLESTCQNYLDCEDNNPCTIDDCRGFPLRCINKPVLYCKNDDDCCPERCDYKNDNDCEHCFSDTDCDDNNNMTKDTCETETGRCFNDLITECIDDDSACPEGCSRSEDNDCPAVCGDDVCDEEEDCCDDCGCDEGYSCSDSACKEDKVLILEILSDNQIITEKKEEFFEKGYTIDDTIFTKKDDFFEFTILLSKGDKTSYINGTISGGEVTNANVGKMPGKFNWGIVIWLVSIIIVILFVFGMIHILKTRPQGELSDEIFTKEGESYYQGKPESYYGKENERKT